MTEQPYLYSVIHFCPNIGEAVNVGIIVVTPDANIEASTQADCRIKLTEDWSRAQAMDHAGCLDGVKEYLHELDALNAYDLEALCHHSQNLIQYTIPVPVIGVDPDQAMERVWREFFQGQGRTAIHLTQKQQQKVVSILKEHATDCDDYAHTEEAAETRELVDVFEGE